MKKLFLLILCIFSFIFCTSCDNKDDDIESTTDKYEGKSGKITCKLETNTQEFNFIGTYNITYEDGYVTETYTREVMNMSDNASIDKYIESLKSEYSKYDNLEHYEYSINSSSNKVINNSYIDYKNIDLEDLSRVSGDNKIEKNDLRVSKTLASYKILGAKCEEE